MKSRVPPLSLHLYVKSSIEVEPVLAGENTVTRFAFLTRSGKFRGIEKQASFSAATAGRRENKKRAEVHMLLGIPRLGRGYAEILRVLAPQPRLGTEVLRGSFLVKESVLGSA
jgi:hypothetical protein